jgi:hypothetical protein
MNLSSMERSRCVRIARDSYPELLVTSDRRFAEGGNAFLLAMPFNNSKWKCQLKKTSTTFVLLVLGAASLNAALTLPASAQTKTPSTQTCANASTARDNRLRPDARCLMTPEQYVEEQNKKQALPPTALGPGEVWVPAGPRGPTVNYNDIKSGKVGVVQGSGGSGGSRGGTSAR